MSKLRKDLIEILQRFLLEDPGLVIPRLHAFWRESQSPLSGDIDSKELAAVSSFIDMIVRYEPNPQFCNKAAGMVDGWDIRDAVKELLVRFHASKVD